MKCTIVFVSPNGTTEAGVKLLKEEIEHDALSVQLFNIGRGDLRYDLSPVLQALKGSGLALFGSPVYHMDMLQPMQKLFLQMEQNRGAFACTALLLINYAGITSGKAFLNAFRSLRNADVQVAGALKLSAPHFHHRDQFPDDQTRRLVQDFYLQLKVHRFRPMSPVRARTIFRPEKRRVSVLYPLIHLIGKKRELPITIDQDTCRLCSKCANECPVGAIAVTPDKGTSLNPGSCIHCYHCTLVCPFGAIHSPIEKLDKMIAGNKRIIGTEDPASMMYI